MAPPTPGETRARAGSFRTTAWAAGLIVIAGLIAYHNTHRAPFEFDDIPGITRNPSIQHLSSLWTVLNPPLDLTVSGRPVLNLSFAFNYALGGLDVATYHHWNLAIHLLAGLALFGIARRTLRRILPGEEPPESATRLACAISLLWTLHPLQTESITYIVQRAESLMGLFYLATIYFFIGAAEARERSPERLSRSYVGWAACCVGSCLLGMGTKEVMVSAPVMALLYDRTFIGGSFGEAWKRRRGLHACLAATWAPLLWVALHTKSRNGTSGFGIGIGWWQYARTQFPALVHYIKLSFLPRGQVFDYGTQWTPFTPAVARDAAIVGALAAGSVAAFFPGMLPERWRKPARHLGFLGLWFFAILSPTSLIPGNRQTLAEHRMYLALAPVVATSVLAVHWAFRRAGRAIRALAPSAGEDAVDSGLGDCEWVLFLALAATLGWMTEKRNDVYRNELALWADTVARCPSNPWARNNFGNMLLRWGYVQPAIRQYELALEIKPSYSESRNNLATALVRVGKIDSAKQEFEGILSEKGTGLGPAYEAEVRNNLGVALYQDGKYQAAEAEFLKAMALKANYGDAHVNYGNALLKMGRFNEAIAEYREGLRLDPAYAEIHNNLGNVYFKVGDLPNAIAEYSKVVSVRPSYLDGRNNLGTALLKAGRLRPAIGQYLESLRINPRYAPTHFYLGNALAQAGQVNFAVEQYFQAVALNPKYAEAHSALGNVLLQSGRFQEAAAQFSTALALRPDNAEARSNLGSALAAEGRTAEAVAQYREAIALGLDIPAVHYDLGGALAKLGRRDEAAAEFRKALKQNPTFEEARTELEKLAPAARPADKRPPDR